MSCFCDYELPSFYVSRMRQARTKKRCSECDRTIAPGELYEGVAGKWEGDFRSYETCGDCVKIRKFVEVSIPCFCWGHGNLEEDVKIAIEDAYDRAKPEVSGLAFAVGRMLVKRNRKRFKAAA